MNSSNVNSAGRWAGVVSVIFHPVLLPIYGLLVLFFSPTILLYYPPPRAKLIIFLMVLLNNVIVPMVLLLIFRSRNIISSYKLEKREERIIPMLCTSLLYLITTLLLYRLNLPAMLKGFLFASSSVVFVASLITFKMKVSIHATGMGALVATALILSFRMQAGMLWLIIALFFVAGVVMSARLVLQAHSPVQVYIGFLTGLAAMTAGFMV